MRCQVAARLCFCAASASVAAASAWEHDWATPASAWWGYGAMNGGVFSDADVAFIASTYRVVVISACLGASNASVALTIMGVSARLKALNPSIKVLQYWNMQQWACYSPGEPDYAAFLAHPSWWLLDDSGKPVLNNGSPQYDWQNPAAVQHWLGMPVESGGVVLLDGFLLDGAAVYDPEAGINPNRTEALKLAKWAAVGLMQQRLGALNGGLVIANGMAGGPIDPFVDDPFNLGVLAYADGIENERATPAFEYVDPVTGAFNKTLTALNLAAVEQAGQGGGAANGTKVVVQNYWAGPIVGFSSSHDNTSGWPVFAPADPNDRAPNGTEAEVMRGWAALLDQWLPFNLASFLTVAGPGTYFTQMVWYASFQGFLACPDAPATCCAPQPFYPELHRPLGPPLGPRQQVGAFRWVRRFEHAVVTLDLEDPLGPGTSIVWS